MIAYKFLCAGGLGPFSRYAWPLPHDGRPGNHPEGCGGPSLWSLPPAWRGEHARAL